MIYKRKNLYFLSSIINKIKTRVFSIETQYKFLKINKIVEEEMTILNEQRQLLILKYGEKDSEGKLVVNKDGGVKIMTDQIDECSKSLKELDNIDITFPDLYFSLSELSDLNLSLEDLIYLEPFIKN